MGEIWRSKIYSPFCDTLLSSGFQESFDVGPSESDLTSIFLDYVSPKLRFGKTPIQNNNN